MTARPARNPCGLRTGRRSGRPRPSAAHSCSTSAARGSAPGPNPNGPAAQLARRQRRRHQPHAVPAVAEHRVGRHRRLPERRRGSRALTRQRRQPDPPDERAARAAGHAAAPGGPIKHVFYIVTREPHLRPGPGRRRRAATATPSWRCSASDTTPNVHALGRALPAARPRLRELRGVDRRPLLDERGEGLRLRQQELVPELRRPRPPVRLRRLRGHLAGQRLPLRPGRAPGDLATSTTARRSPGRVPLTDKDRTPAGDAGEVAASSPSRDLGGRNGLLRQRRVDRRRLDHGRTRCSTRSCRPGAPTGRDVALRLLPAALPRAARDGAPSRRSTTSSLTNDHTHARPRPAQANRTPPAMIADNDECLGRIVDAISHSPIWKSSAIFVIEDDSQDGADHVDAHRIPAFVISPVRQAGRGRPHPLRLPRRSSARWS